MIRTGRFDSCTTKNSTKVDIMKCCLESCRPLAESCMKSCDNDIGCMNKCARIILSCENTCALSDPNIWRGNSKLVECIEEKGCGKYPDYNAECIKKNEYELMKCCKQNCIPTREMDCNTHCTMKYGDYIGESKDPLLRIYDKYLKKGKYPTFELPRITSRKSIFLIIPIAIGFICALILVIVLKTK